jgi:hypothetical protein
MSSNDDAAGLMAAFKMKASGGRKSSAASPRSAKQTSLPPAAILSEDGAEVQGDTIRVDVPPLRRKAVAVRVEPKKFNKREYTYYEVKDEVEEITREFSRRRGEMLYEVRIFPGQTKQVSESPSERWVPGGKGGRPRLRLYALSIQAQLPS